MRVKGKVALITGGAGGIGEATARLLAAEGATVVITDMADGTQMSEEIGASYFRHDVTDAQQWCEIVGEVAVRHGGLDILVNAAGIEGNLSDSSPLGSFVEWRRVMSVNLDGTFLGVNTALPVMMARGAGSIINLASLVTYIGTPFSMPYGASKAAVWHLSRSVAAFVALSGTAIRCNSVHPGLIRTRMTDSILDSMGKLQAIDPAAAEQELLRMVPAGKRGEPTDVANLILFLASDESAYITGSEFKVDGGWSLSTPR